MVILEDRGLFWRDDTTLPDRKFAPDCAVWGALTVDETGLTSLELDGILSDPGNVLAAITRPEHKVSEFQAIRGLLKASGKRVYLTKIFKLGGRVHTANVSYERWRAQICLVREVDFPPYPWEPEYTSLGIELCGFEEWLGLSDVHMHAQPDDDNNLRISYTPPADLTHSSEGTTITVKYNFYRPRFGSRFSSLEVKQTATIFIGSQRATSLDQVGAECGFVWEFLVLLTNCERTLEWPELVLKSDTPPCTMYFTRINSGDELPAMSRFWVPFPAVRERFGELFLAWRRFRLRVGPGAYLYLGTRRGLPMYFEHTYVNIIWGIEALHRVMFPTDTLSPELIAKKDRVLLAIANKDKRWLERIFKHALGKRLEDRILEVLMSLPIKLDRAAATLFSQQCAERRNAISHGGGPSAAGGDLGFREDLEQRIAALSFLYHALLLNAIGISDERLHYHFYESFRSYEIQGALRVFALLPDSKSSIEAEEV